jgi:Transposase DDE domain
MPRLVWHYLTALLYDGTSASCMALAEALQTVSHDRLTRLLPADWSGQRLLELACRTLFGWERGSLISDDTVRAQPFATAIAGLAWVYASQDHQPVDGLSLVLWVWTHGTVRIPLGLRLWIKGGPAKDVLALAWRSYARHRLRCDPESVRFDAWYPSKSLLQRMRGDGWYVVCRLKKHRRCNGHAVHQPRRHPYWTDLGWLSGGLNVRVVRDGKQYSAPTRLTLPAAEVRGLDGVRTQIEEVIRVCTDQVTLTGCRARSQRAQLQQIACCLSAFCGLERERHDRQLSIYKLTRQRSCKAQSCALPALELLKSAA